MSPDSAVEASGGVFLTLDATGQGCCAALVRDDQVLASRRHEAGRGAAALLPALVAAVLVDAALIALDLRAVVVTVGPGSFTGVRAALALATGIGAGIDVPVRGVTLGDSLRADLAAVGVDRPVWVVSGERNGRVFLDRGGTEAVRSLSVEAIPAPSGPVLLAGDSAPLFAGREEFRVLELVAASPLGIVRAALSAPRAAVPLYVEAVAARPNPATRPMPA